MICMFKLYKTVIKSNSFSLQSVTLKQYQLTVLSLYTYVNHILKMYQIGTHHLQDL